MLVGETTDIQNVQDTPTAGHAHNKICPLCPLFLHTLQYSNNLRKTKGLYIITYNYNI